MLSCAICAGLLAAPDSISGQPRYKKVNDDVSEYLRAKMAPATLEYVWHEWVEQNATNHYGVNPLLFQVFAENPDMGDDEQAALAEAYCTPLWSLEKLRRLLSSMTSDFMIERGITVLRGTDRLPTVIKYPKTPASIANTIKDLLANKAGITSDQAKTYDSMVKAWEPKLNLLSTAANFHSSERYHTLDRLHGVLADQIAADEIDDTELQKIQETLRAVTSSMRISDAIMEQIRIGPYKTMQELIRPDVDTALTDAERIAKGMGAIDPRQTSKRNVVAAFAEGLGLSTSSPDKAGRGGSNTADASTAVKKLKKKTGKAPKAGTSFACKARQSKSQTPGAMRRINATANKRQRQQPSGEQVSVTGQGTNMPRPKGSGKPQADKRAKQSGNGGRGRQQK